MDKALSSVTEARKQQIMSRYLAPAPPHAPEKAVEAPLARLVPFALGVLAVLSVAGVLLVRLVDTEKLAANFGSARLRLLVLGGMVLLAVIVSGMGLVSVEAIRARVLRDIERTLRSSISVANNAMELWVGQCMAQIRQIGHAPQLGAIAQELALVEPRATFCWHPRPSSAREISSPRPRTSSPAAASPSRTSTRSSWPRATPAQSGPGSPFRRPSPTSCSASSRGKR
jgi:hypothetical protein